MGAQSEQQIFAMERHPSFLLSLPLYQFFTLRRAHSSIRDEAGERKSLTKPNRSCRSLVRLWKLGTEFMKRR